MPRPPCVRAASPYPRKLGSGYAALPQMAGRRDRMLALFPLWRASARRVNSLASRLPGTTRLRFALHGAQRLIAHIQPWLNLLKNIQAYTTAQGENASLEFLADRLTSGTRFNVDPIVKTVIGLK